MPTVIEVVQGDITKLAVDAIVNAANRLMLGGGGVDGAIHRAAGPGLYEACKAVPQVTRGVRCPTGEARITPGFALPARFVIHTVGPVWHGGIEGEEVLLASCYAKSLRLAMEHGLASIAFPAISCGIYQFPPGRAAGIAVNTVRDLTSQPSSLERVVLVAFDDLMKDRLAAVLAAPPPAQRLVWN